jgi:hypothetical protein
VHSELHQLLGSHPDKALTQGLARPSSSSAGSSKKQQKQPAGAVDSWVLLDILDAANLLLWADLVRPGEQGCALAAGCGVGWVCSSSSMTAVALAELCEVCCDSTAAC